MKFKSMEQRKAVMASMKNKFAFSPVWQHEFDVPVDANTLIAAGSGSAFLPNNTQLMLKPSLGLGFSRRNLPEQKPEIGDKIADSIVKFWPEESARGGESRGLGIGDRLAAAVVGLWPDEEKKEEEVIYVVEV